VARSRLAAAVRRGLVVISYRAGLARKRVEQLRALQSVAPQGTIVTPDDARARGEILVAAYRRLLACPRFTDVALDALRLFRGRYIGIGPDR
jgi:chloramphenicol 3-O-phosphotransferase